MRSLKRKLNLSERGWRDFRRAVVACTLSDLSMLLPFAVIVQAIVTLAAPLAFGVPFDTARMWLLFGCGLGAAKRSKRCVLRDDGGPHHWRLADFSRHADARS